MTSGNTSPSCPITDTRSRSAICSTTRGGLRNYNRLLELSGHLADDVTTDDDALRVLARQKAPNFQPGSEFVYNNTGYFLLSLVVKRVTGASLQDVARERLFTPLGMRRTHFLRSYDAIVPDRAVDSPVSGNGFRSDMPRSLQIGDGGVWNSVEELLRGTELLRRTDWRQSADRTLGSRAASRAANNQLRRWPSISSYRTSCR